MEYKEVLRVLLILSHPSKANTLCQMCDSKETGKPWCTCVCAPLDALQKIKAKSPQKKHLATKILVKDEYEKI